MRGLIYIITARFRHRCITIEEGEAEKGKRDGRESAVRLIHVGRSDRGRLYVVTSSNASTRVSGDRDEEAEGAGVTMGQAGEVGTGWEGMVEQGASGAKNRN